MANKDFNRKFDHYDRTRAELGLQAAWSIFNVDNLSGRHPFEGADRVVYEEHWGDNRVECCINGSTWAALYIAANACIRDSGDNHHIYIESFEPSSENPKVLILRTGS